MAVMKGQEKGRFHDVATTFMFWIELDDIFVAGFSQVSGLEAETEIEEYREGGVNGYVHKLPKGVRFPNLVLSKGMTKSPALWSWYESTIEGTIERKTGAIVLQSADGTEFGRWSFFDAYPVKWTGPQLNASTSDVAVETIEIIHSGLYGDFQA
ncbi:phage tail-like protein [Paenibacillus endophyticus]|uniref:Phage tail-like protein n=1 Tax=Paenibacillus endophyticus TaxID=1294268 RepID=A0A7W5CAP3_9BACL|nr:phage tail protein [Paenibacillus endophyticus]MBB3154228.1 phage tail-like protein [Paenibacillus endophyticus]